MGRIRRCLLSALCVPVIAAPAPSTAQVLEEWSIVYSGRSYDYLVTERGLERVGTTASGIEITRVVVSRMLVRYIEEARQDIIRTRTASGRDVAGYDAYASSTFVLEMQCTSGLIRVTDTVDFDDAGSVLERQTHESDWGPGPPGWDSRAMARIRDRACRPPARLRIFALTASDRADDEERLRT